MANQSIQTVKFATGGKAMKQRNDQLEPRGDRLNLEILNMLKIMSHDIRGSLVSISATLKLLIRGYYGKMDDAVANSLKELLSKTISLVGITEEYLGRTFCVEGDLESEDELLNLMKDVINPVLDELSAELKEHPIWMDHCSDAMSNKGIPIKASRIGLKAVFRNLLRNAIKHGGKGCTITLGFEDHGGSYRLNVYNSGKPVPEEYRDKLFSKFMRYGNNGIGNGGTHGMGLGLYLTKKIIEKHGGAIWYEAEENGSNFIFTLPLRLTFSEEPLLPIKPAQPRLAAVR
jgi:signal transduction histidine kinase